MRILLLGHGGVCKLNRTTGASFKLRQQRTKGSFKKNKSVSNNLSLARHFRMVIEGKFVLVLFF